MKRIVITSSVGTVWTAQSEPRTFTEEDWNEHTMHDYEAGHRDPETTYYSSKILAEKGQPASWIFVFYRLTSHLQRFGSLCKTTEE